VRELIACTRTEVHGRNDPDDSGVDHGLGHTKEALSREQEPTDFDRSLRRSDVGTIGAVKRMCSTVGSGKSFPQGYGCVLGSDNSMVLGILEHPDRSRTSLPNFLVGGKGGGLSFRVQLICREGVFNSPVGSS
jgi:hypothetical protein